MVSLTQKVISGDFIALSGLKFHRYIYLWEVVPPITPLAEAAPYFCQHSLLVVELLPQRPRARISSSESKHKTKLNLSEAVQIKKKTKPTPKLAMY